MKKSIHAKTIYRSNILSDIRIAHEAGYTAVELVGSQVLNFLESGLSIRLVLDALEKYNIKVVSINDLAHVERTEPDFVEELLKDTENLCEFAKEVQCNCIQLVPLCAHEGKPWEEILRLTSETVVKVLDIGKKYGIHFQLEPVAWSPINSLSKSLEFIEYTKRDNIKMVIDFWHLWYGNETEPKEVAALDKSMIANIHFCDGKRNEPGTVCDEEDLRGYYAGEGDIPLQDWIDAVKQTGYDGYWSYELISKRHWEMDTKEVAEATSKLMDKFVFN